MLVLLANDGDGKARGLTGTTIGDNKGNAHIRYTTPASKAMVTNS